jgi:hypothetical protein
MSEPTIRKLEFIRLDNDPLGQLRYSIIRDDRQGPCAYLTVDIHAADVLVPLLQAAPELLAALSDLLVYESPLVADKVNPKWFAAANAIARATLPWLPMAPNKEVGNVPEA